MKPRTVSGSAIGVLAFVALATGARPAGASDASYEIRKDVPRATVGVASSASVTVLGANGWHVNEQAPITMTVKADPGVSLPKPRLTRADLAESSKQSARFEIPFSAAAAGKKTITADARFVMCQEQACKPCLLYTSDAADE